MTEQTTKTPVVENDESGTPEQNRVKAEAKVGVLHQAHADYIEANYGVKVDPLFVFLMYSTRNRFRKTDDYKTGVRTAKSAEAEQRREAAEAAKAEAKAEREKVAAEKAAAKEAEKAAKAEEREAAKVAKEAEKAAKAEAKAAEKAVASTDEPAPAKKRGRDKAATAEATVEKQQAAADAGF